MSLTSPRSIPNILSIAGTDPTGGAGIQADLKSFAAHRGYGMCVVTALVAQNTQGVREIHLPPVSFLRAQLDAVSDDVALDAIKIGMLGTEEIISTVAAWLDALARSGRQGHGSDEGAHDDERAHDDDGAHDDAVGPRPVLVLDPVMVATSGDRLLDAAAESALIGFLHRADLITPNVPELALLAGSEPATDPTGLISQARTVADEHQVVVLAKGGHLDDASAQEVVVDTLVYPESSGVRPAEEQFLSPRIHTQNTHGTGCSVSAALATLAARGHSWSTALPVVKDWMTEALKDSERLDVGQGHGPIQHFAQLWR
ncbi:bifunctional hydroxymethylpyrimidine kinase/phosphomethylpyrimidine kinase [Nesterenkonia sp. E16_7]|uniref:bifunctional hydroxymethylpyrimidine kinase/phosphomethylpyrimidine kinase n=1 Tax=unclassified Nesterenkonia TaxID=2629769 RepID=UPI001A92FC83|nr:MULTISPECIES: bifunctional hydroxymethylpyrimidine kinase/phosphomethylpyrimidine kinase [unclassified Nesterenkonia]MBO0595897.1 bifunctional hydroxymethylpyrimidine kinase/phosphomethylpyrimidine kinase [Nesterenkonia sp. E16_10]MBO0599504.1 bifunctional hydroxymethylpyrimidine kinase/phosphomethylpyrimidine kinase [Nesterenkonia sp. E16_7]